MVDETGPVQQPILGFVMGAGGIIVWSSLLGPCEDRLAHTPCTSADVRPAADGIVTSTRAPTAVRRTLPRVVKDCADIADSDDYLDVGDQGRTLTLIDKSDGVLLACVLMGTEATTALQGRQYAKWGDFKASWTYHPDNGVNLIIEDVHK